MVDGIPEQYKDGEFEDIGYAVIDRGRMRRCGHHEVIFGAGKTAEQIAGITAKMLDGGVPKILVTKADEEKFISLHNSIPNSKFLPKAGLIIIGERYTSDVAQPYGAVCVVTAGTSDISVAEEAAETAAFFGHNVRRIYDVGVAGISRLFTRLPEIRAADVIIAVAGMEGALASVIGGLTDKPLIAVPTSVGYGANFGGVSALLAMLNSCASGVGVVNIDNGFGAAMLAHKILRLRRD